MLRKLRNYASFIKIEHTLFSLPLLYSGAFLAADGVPSWKVLLLVLTAGTGARTAAFGLNRIIDRELDKRNPRTASRELPAGKMSISEARLVTLAGALVYLISAFWLSPFLFYLSPFPLLIFTFYPYLKRFTVLSHFGIGLADALAPLGGYLAGFTDLDSTPPVLTIHSALLATFMFFWVSGFDILYAQLDVDFDRKEGLFSLPARWGQQPALLVSRILHFCAFLALFLLYLQLRKNFVGFILLAFIGVLLAIEQWNARNVELAFFQINAVLGFIVFLFIFALVFP